jgi:hypothetical protein
VGNVASEEEEQEEEKEEDTVEKEENERQACFEKLTPVGRRKKARRLNKAREETNPNSTKKLCTSCLVDKVLAGFWKDSGGYFGRRSKCKACISKHRKKGEVVKYKKDGDKKEQEQEQEVKSKDEEVLMKAHQEEGNVDPILLTTEECRNEARRRNRELGDDSTTKWCCSCLVLYPADMLGRRSDCQACKTHGGRQAMMQPQSALRYTHVYCNCPHFLFCWTHLIIDMTFTGSDRRRCRRQRQRTWR